VTCQQYLWYDPDSEEEPVKHSVSCPRCGGKLNVNPLGRWFAKFKCGHCGTPLQFDLLTNALGVTAAALFGVGGIYLALLGYDELAQRFLPYAVWGWLVLLLLSYDVRRVVIDTKRK
jgi:DNA-directed RNA polymerase subunit RPC12/RpoP